MPTYRYECQACGHTFEVFQSITAKTKRKCPQCGQPKLERLIGAGGGIIFKGSGFYETDYRSDSYKAGEKAASSDSSKSSDSGKSSDSSSKSSKKSDTKKTDSKKSD